MAPKLAVLPTLFLLLGSVASQGFNSAPSASPTAAPVPRRVLSPMHAPSSNAPPAYPPRGAAARPSSSAAAPPVYDPVASSPGPSAASPVSGSTSSSAAPPVYDPVASSPGPSAASPVSGPTSSSAAPPVYDPVASSPGPSAASPVSGPTSSSAAPPVYPVAPSPGPSASSPVSGPTSSSAAPPVYPVASSPGPSASSPVSGPTAVPNQPPSPGPAPAGLRVGYYSYSCPNAEAIVREAVKSAAASNPGIGAGLIRLLFHDCFVHGCDASVLLNTTGSAAPTERQSPPNLSLRGFEVIDAAKAALEAACPGVVSCADVVAFAGRDATYFLSGNAVDFGMPAGRYDGRVSLSSEALDNLPPPTADLKTLKDMFEAKGLDTDDMVTLSGAHTVGVSHCSSFSDRIPPNNASSDSMNPTLAASLGQQCGGGGDPTVVQDLVTPNKLDSQYYWNVLNHDVLFTSDAALLASNQTADMVSANAFTPGLWETKFKAAMVKMGSVGIKTSADGEIREKCWMIN